MQRPFISLSSIATVVLVPALGGVIGGEANASTTLTVITDNPAGYSLTIINQTTPALQSGPDSISDYVPISAADYSFQYGVGESVFGFSPTGTDVTLQFLDDGIICGVAVSSTPERCWIGASTTAQELARAAISNHPVGATTTIHFRVGIGSEVNQAPGSYLGTTTITALPL